MTPFVDHARLREHRDEVVRVDVRRDLPGRPGAAACAEAHLVAVGELPAAPVAL